MNVILEGPDGAGKSTLANYLSPRLGLELRHSGGPGKYPGEVEARAVTYINDPTPRLYDRHPCVSQNVYNAALVRTNAEWVPRYVVDAFYATSPIIVYCRPIRKLKDHGISEHAPTKAHNDAVESNYGMLCRNYDEWALKHATITYRIGDDPERIVSAIRGIMEAKGHALTDAIRSIRNNFDPLRDVEEFHDKFGLRYHGAPRMLPEDLAGFRQDFHQEEQNEYCDAVAYARRELEQPTFDSNFDDRNFREYMEKALDSLVDLVYVVLGTADLHGFDFRRAWNRVHAANMKKVRATKGLRTKRGNGEYDIRKPPGWVAPSHADLVRYHAHIQKPSVDHIAGSVQTMSASVTTGGTP